MKKIMSMCMVLVLMISIYSLAIADDSVENFKVGFEFEAENDMIDALGNETEDPDGNESEDPDGNETEEPDGNETEEPDGNESDIDDDTEEEIEIMNNTLGAEIRLLQLEKAITKNLLKGERAVAVLKAMEYNTTELDTVLEEMRQVLEEVQAVNASANDSVQQFVDLKSDAKKLTTEFREAIKELLSDVKIKELKEQIKEIVGEELQNYSKKIQNRIKQFNRNQIHRLYGIIGVTNESLADAYQDGNITMEHEVSLSSMVHLAMAAHNSGGKVIAQVKRVVERGTLKPQLVKVPGVLVDAIVVDENQKQATGIDYDPAASGQVRVPLSQIEKMPFGVEKILARRSFMALSKGYIVNLG
ncbi:MAG: hypothetical protein LN364_03685, partial [Candidatus Thermoplasmatota archaeon]|nr:hypothetical protein [Candidatus Thermoplasmatota archaeon]